MKNHIFVLSILAGTALWAQQAQRVFVMDGAGERFEGSTVTGAPYSAMAVTTSTQTLGDGTKITRKIEAQLARDSQGRTRREQTSDAVGPWSTNGKDHSVIIRDPVSQASYNIQPDEKNAVKIPMGPQNFKIAFDEHHATGGQVRTFTVSGETVRVMAGPSEKAQVEDLGSQVIEGVNVKGKRETTTIPVGQIGNDRPIQVVSETWYSEELQMVILSRHSDPRVGESEYRLTNISRTEPAASLFEVPAGYRMKEEQRR